MSSTKAKRAGRLALAGVITAGAIAAGLGLRHALEERDLSATRERDRDLDEEIQFDPYVGETWQRASRASTPPRGRFPGTWPDGG